MNVIRKVAVWMAIGFGLGLSPVASGTFGTLLGLPLVYAINTYAPGIAAQTVIALVLSLLAIPICTAAEQVYQTKDDGRIVADEWMTFPVCMIGLPVTPLMLGIAFVTSRVFDIIKPPPARGLQRLKSGLGIVIDDFIANIYCLAVNWGIYWALVKYHILAG